jgi:hypothetical protein
MGYLLLANLTTFETNLLPVLLFRHLEASGGALGKSPSSGEPNTFARAHSSG